VYQERWDLEVFLDPEVSTDSPDLPEYLALRDLLVLRETRDLLALLDLQV